MDEAVLNIIIKARDQATKQLQAVNKSIGGFSGVVGGAMKKAEGSSKVFLAGLAAAGVAIAALATKFILLPGIDRALNIEDAQAKLRGLGHDAQSVENIMKSALAAVKGTAFGLDAAATTAATAVAAGVEPGKQLTRYLGLTADAATIAGTSMSAMGGIFNKVETVQAAYNDTLLQLSEQGIPIYQWLSEELGISAEAVKKLASEGGISSKVFKDAIEKNIGGAALESGKTTRGAWANMGAAMARVGAKIAEDVIPKMRDAFVSITDWFDKNSDKIVDVVGKIIDGVGKVAGVIGKVFSVLPPQANLMIIAGAILGGIVPALVAMAVAGWAAIAPLLPFIAIGAAVGAIAYLIIANWDTLKAWFSAFWQFMVTLWNDILNVGRTVWQALVTVVTTVFNAIWAVIKPFIDLWVLQFQIWFAVVSYIFLVIKGLVTVVIQWLWNNIIKPYITLWINIFKSIWAVVSSVFTNVKNFIGSAISWVWQRISPVLSNVRSGFNSVWDTVSNVFNKIKNTIGGVASSISGGFSKAFEGAKNIAKGAVNWMIDKINTVIRGVNNTAGKLPGVPDIGEIPKLAKGGVVKSRPGGTAAILGEAGQDEAVIPLGNSSAAQRIRAALGGGSASNEPQQVVNITNNNTFVRDTDPLAFARMQAFELSRR